MSHVLHIPMFGRRRREKESKNDKWKHGIVFILVDTFPVGTKALAAGRPAVRQAALCLGLNAWPPFKDRRPRTGASVVTGPLCNCTVFN